MMTLAFDNRNTVPRKFSLLVGFAVGLFWMPSCFAARIGCQELEASDESMQEDTLDEDELRLIELRRQFLAELNDQTPDDHIATALPLSIADLDKLKVFAGSIGPLPETPTSPKDNESTELRVDLGRHLYFDKRLSQSQTLSCASCHQPGKGWSDGVALAKVRGKNLNRHSPTILNVGFNDAQFWDGRVSSLEEQALGPILSPDEMGMPDEASVVKVIQNAPEYQGRFEAAYGQEVSFELIGKAIAAFERTIVTGHSRFDMYASGDKSALDESEKRGLILFTTTGSCTACHKGSNFTDNQFYSLGLKRPPEGSSDIGRYLVSKSAKDKYAFKTPGLRNVAQTAPYMHDGSVKTLEEVVEFYDRGGDEKAYRSELIRPLKLSRSQKQDLVNFLKSLSGSLPSVECPQGEFFGY